LSQLNLNKISRSLMFEEVARRIRNLIEDEDLWGKYLAPERDLAELFDVSRDTVRRGLDLLQQEGLLKRRQGLGTRVIETSPAAPATIKGNLLVGCCAGHASEFMSGIAQEAGQHRWLPSFNNLITPKGRSEFLLRTKSEGVDGVILLSPVEEELISELQRVWQGPLVIADHYFPDKSITFVMEDCSGGFRQITEHLLALGHTRIGYVGHIRTQLNPWKYAGYADSLKSAGIAVDPELSLHAAHTFESGLHAAKLLLALKDQPTAIVTSSDSQAWGAWRAIELAGLTVGQDIALTGYGDSSRNNGFDPGLTSVAYDLVEIGRKSMELLVQLAEGHCSGHELKLVPTQLIIRDSSKNVRGPAVNKQNLNLPQKTHTGENQ
jgi:LacI family transcriptional regulator, galactose operon repressor